VGVRYLAQSENRTATSDRELTEAPKAENASDLSGSLAEMRHILTRLEQFSLRMEQSRIAEYMNYLENPRQLLRVNLLMGMARGFGFAVGLTVLSAVVIYILQMVIRMNLPLISKFVADIFYLANQYLEAYGR